jgi:thiamine kinase-like enzyme
LNHILIHDDELVLVDLDSLRMGHPAYDLANFLSSLYYLEALERISPAVRCDIARHVLQGYAQGAPRPVSSAAVLWFLASLLVSKQAAKCVAHLQPGRRDRVQAFLTLAHAALARARDAGERNGVETLWTVLP